MLQTKHGRIVLQRSFGYARNLFLLICCQTCRGSGNGRVSQSSVGSETPVEGRLLVAGLEFLHLAGRHPGELLDELDFAEVFVLRKVG